MFLSAGIIGYKVPTLTTGIQWVFGVYFGSWIKYGIAHLQEYQELGKKSESMGVILPCGSDGYRSWVKWEEVEQLSFWRQDELKNIKHSKWFFGSRCIEIIAIRILKLDSSLVKLNHQKIQFKILIAQKILIQLFWV